MNHVTEETVFKCPTCSRFWLSPTTTCEECDRQAFFEERQRWSDGATVVRAVTIDPYNASILAVTVDGNFVKVQGAGPLLWRHPTEHHDALIADLTRLKKENQEVLAENARLRRRLEKKG